MNQVIRKLTERVTNLENNLVTLKDPNKTQLDQFLDIIAEMRSDGPAHLKAEQQPPYEMAVIKLRILLRCQLSTQ